jgi:hypothetical protein
MSFTCKTDEDVAGAIKPSFVGHEVRVSAYVQGDLQLRFIPRSLQVVAAAYLCAFLACPNSLLIMFLNIVGNWEMFHDPAMSRDDLFRGL